MTGFWSPWTVLMGKNFVLEVLLNSMTTLVKHSLAKPTVCTLLSRNKHILFWLPYQMDLKNIFFIYILHSWWNHHSSIVWSEMKHTDKWQCYDHFRPFFCHMYILLSQNWVSDGHFEVLNWSKLWLVRKVWHKTQMFPFPFFRDFVQNQTFAFFVVLHLLS